MIVVLRPVLVMYNSAIDLKVRGAASSYGLGAVLCQNEDIQWKPFAYSSRTMTH